MVKPILPGLVALEASGDPWTIAQLIDVIDSLDGWRIASEIDSSQAAISEQITLLLMQGGSEE